MDDQLDQFTEDRINGSYGDILDQIAAEECAEEYIDGQTICSFCDDEGCDECLPYNDVPLDGDHDSTMTSIGWGTDEDYGYFGGDNFGDC
jgi:hypothetical protein